MVFLFPMAHGSPLSYLDALDAPFFPFGPVFGGHRFAASRAQRHPKDVRPASKNWFGTCFGLWKLRSDRYGQELILQVSRYWTSWSIFFHLCPFLKAAFAFLRKKGPPKDKNEKGTAATKFGPSECHGNCGSQKRNPKRS